MTTRTPLLLTLTLFLGACGGSGSETPPPVEPVPPSAQDSPSKAKQVAADSDDSPPEARDHDHPAADDSPADSEPSGGSEEDGAE